MLHLEKKTRRLSLVIMLIMFGLIYYLLAQSDSVGKYMSNPKALQELILGFGFWAPLVIIGVQIFQQMISVFPSQVTTVASGFIFGPVLGLLYSLIGAFIGSGITFLISRRYGEKLAMKLFNRRELVHFDHFFRQKKDSAVFLARMTPLFPNDVVSFAAGLTKIGFRNFALISTSGFIIQMLILTYFGAELASGTVQLPLIILFALVSLLFIITLFKNQIKRIIIKDFHSIEKGLKQGVKFMFL